VRERERAEGADRATDDSRTSATTVVGGAEPGPDVAEHVQAWKEQFAARHPRLTMLSGRVALSWVLVAVPARSSWRWPSCRTGHERFR
jgi:hypothetical protein